MTAVTTERVHWLSKPEQAHAVQFYPSEDALLRPLFHYVSRGLRNEETCIVIATDVHLKKLGELLRQSGVNLSIAHTSGQYMTFDATEALEGFMVKDRPSWSRFVNSIGDIVQQAARRGKPVRAYGEMVALLWKAGNKEAVIQLEEFWNRLGKRQPHALYCAYPELHFVMNKQEMTDIRRCHNLHIAGSAS